MGRRGNIFSIASQIIKDSRDQPLKFGSGLLNEHIYISAYQRLSIEDLKKVSYIISKIIKLKKEKYRQSVDAGNLDKSIRSDMASNDQK